MQNLSFNTENEIIEVSPKDKNILKSLVKSYRLSEKFILENADLLDWNIISQNQNITVKIGLQLPQYIKWGKIKNNLNANDDLLLLAKHKGYLPNIFKKELDFKPFVRRNQDVLNWHNVPYEYFSKDFLEEMGDKVNWDKALTKDLKDENFIRRNLEKIDKNKSVWLQISAFQSVSEQFLRDFQTKINFQSIGQKNIHVLSDAFVEDFKYALDPNLILKNQKNNLSPNYLKAYKNFDIKTFYQNITEEWIKTQPTHIFNWWHISEFTTISDDFILEHLDKLHIYKLSTNHHFSEDFIRKIFPKMKTEQSCTYLFSSQGFSQEFFEEFMEELNTKLLSSNHLLIQNFSEDFIRKHAKKFDFDRLSQVRRFSRDFLREFAKEWDWNFCITKFQRVSNAFLTIYADKFTTMGWCNLSIHQNLSEEFMRKFPQKLNWGSISKFQTLSEDFIRDFQDKVNWRLLCLNKENQFSEVFKTEFADKIEEISAGELNNHFALRAYEIARFQNATVEELENANFLVEKALFYQSKTVMAGKPTYTNYVKMLILMALGKKEEAFLIVKWALDVDKKFEFFQSFYKDKSYLEWLENGN